MSAQMLKTVLASASLCVMVCGCRSPEPAAYPIGIWGINRREDLPLIKDAGFSLVDGPNDTNYLNAAHNLGLKVLTSAGGGLRGNFHVERARTSIRGLDRHPALWAWYIADEPDLWSVPPEEVVTVNRRLKSFGAHKPTLLTLSQGYEVGAFKEAADIIMLDRFPIGWMPMANFGQHVRVARLSLGEGRRLIANIQAFDWASFPKLLAHEDPSKFRAPTYEELRCMAYYALAEGANGVFFGSFEDGEWRMMDHRETWNDLCRVVLEVRANQPLFMASHLWWSRHPAWGDPAGGFNEALESSITTAWLLVGEGNFAVAAGDYLLAVNNTAQEHLFSCNIPVNNCAMVYVLGEKRHLAAAQGRLTDVFPPYAVHVYGPLTSEVAGN